jgi:superfamily I DNA/RNA helicase
MLLKNPKIVVLCRDELFENDNDNEISQQNDLKKFIPEGILSLGIRAAKGMEFSDVLLVDFFSSLPVKDQKYWKKRLTVSKDGNKFINTIETEYPEMESVLKLLYTAITRCCNRLIFVETNQTTASDYFFRWLKDKDLAQVHELTPEEESNESQSIGYMSPDEW